MHYFKNKLQYPDYRQYPLLYSAKAVSTTPAIDAETKKLCFLGDPHLEPYFESLYSGKVLEVERSGENSFCFIGEDHYVRCVQTLLQETPGEGPLFAMVDSTDPVFTDTDKDQGLPREAIKTLRCNEARSITMTQDLRSRDPGFCLAVTKDTHQLLAWRILTRPPNSLKSEHILRVKTPTQVKVPVLEIDLSKTLACAVDDARHLWCWFYVFCNEARVRVLCFCSMRMLL